MSRFLSWSFFRDFLFFHFWITNSVWQRTVVDNDTHHSAPLPHLVSEEHGQHSSLAWAASAAAARPLRAASPREGGVSLQRPAGVCAVPFMERSCRRAHFSGGALRPPRPPAPGAAAGPPQRPVPGRPRRSQELPWSPGWALSGRAAPTGLRALALPSSETKERAWSRPQRAQTYRSEARPWRGTARWVQRPVGSAQQRAPVRRERAGTGCRGIDIWLAPWLPGN